VKIPAQASGCSDSNAAAKIRTFGKKPLRSLILGALIIFALFPLTGSAQGVGLVLSGGGAAGFAHIGVIKALEENNIPINYITGTSSGALIGSLYACGYSPAEMEAYVLSNDFQLMSAGQVGRQKEFFLREDDLDAGLIDLRFSADSLFQKSLPTNFIRPQLLDYEMLRLIGTASAARGHSFDSLFVPFRCVASDIVAKRSKVFDSGYLNEAVRASMTYPFFINPIRINGVLYFDGGLYNNFPANVMYESFPADFIIGSNVTNNASPPSEEDLISQITNMLVSYSDFSLPCDEGIMIVPKTNVSTFEFSEVKDAILDGYNSTMLKMDSIRAMVHARVTLDEVNARRAAFRSWIPPLRVSEVNTLNEKGRDQVYVRKSILKNARRETLSPARLERRYFRTYATPQIQFLQPTLDMLSDSTYKLDIDVRKAREFQLDLGGIISSRAVNTGFAQLKYNYLRRMAMSACANIYFGKFYGSGKGQVTFHLPSYFPVSAAAYVVHNRWDYFKNFATFIEDVRPSFLVQYEDYYGGQLKVPIFNNSKSIFDYRRVLLEDRYYQTDEFTNQDTTDVTRFRGNVLSWTIEQNSLNRKQFASEGFYFMIRARYVDGFENSRSGSTAPQPYDIQKYHSWFLLSGELQSFPITSRHFKIGFHGLATVSSQSLFRNYTASLLSMPAFQPLPDMQTYFLPEYRSSQYFAGGLNVIFTFWKNFDLRFDGYIYQPLIQLTQQDDGSFGFSKPFKGETQAASVSGIYHSPIGPVRLSLNYFPEQKNPLMLQFTYGYTIFNERATR
jgi:NTE family protein